MLGPDSASVSMLEVDYKPQECISDVWLSLQVRVQEALHARLQLEHQAAIGGLEQAMAVLTGQSEQLMLDEQDHAALQQHVTTAERALSDSRLALAKAEEANAGRA